VVALLFLGCAGAAPLPRAPALRSTGIAEVEIVAAPARLRLLGGDELEVWAYNGQVPGPTLRVRRGQTLRVRFENRLPQPTTIHWHGVRVPNAMDGVPWVTQDPVPPGGAFVYEFSPPDAGTYWFHPHLRSSEQVERGLYGILVVEEEEPPPGVREILWVLDDWRLGEDGQVEPRFNTRTDLAHDGRWGDVLTVNGRVRPAEPVRAGERLRLRLVNVANGRVFAPDFGGWDPRLVAFDGLPTDRPLGAAGLELAPGNRADLDLLVPQVPAGTRLEVTDRFTSRGRVLATVAVEGAGPEKAAPPPELRLAPWPVELPPDLAEPSHTFRLASREGGPFGIEWTIGGAAYRHEDHAPGGHGGHPVLATLPLGQWVRLRFWNDSFRLHPMHVHGLFFRVVARDGRPVAEERWRDTVLLRPKETVDVAALPLDPGLWMMHCHILEHAESGMMSLLEVTQSDSGSRAEGEAGGK
jgi:FtsP/CotA-like multicopper oxidase with cupredoxin domain